MGEGSPCECTPSCTVVICTRDRPILLHRCLEAVSSLVYPKFDVLVVDNAPSDGRTQEVAKRWSVRYLVEPMAGLNRARNRGARACDTEIVAYLDDDAIPQPDWLSGLAQEFNDPLVMAAAGKVHPVSVETEAERLCPMMGWSEIGGKERLVIDQHAPLWFEIANFGGIGIGANMAFRRQAFQVWSGFDERLDRGTVLDGGGENYAFFFLIAHGYRIVYTPHAVVHHPLPRTMEYLRKRFFRDWTNSTAYMTLLFVEVPKFRFLTMKYALESLKGTRRAWRDHTPGVPITNVFPWWRMLLSVLYGPLLYIRMRLTSSKPALQEDNWLRNSRELL